jgi:hypothetical protein
MGCGAGWWWWWWVGGGMAGTTRRWPPRTRTACTRPRPSPSAAAEARPVVARAPGLGRLCPGRAACPLRARYAPVTRPLCARYAPVTHPFRARYAPVIRPLRARCVPGVHQGTSGDSPRYTLIPAGPGRAGPGRAGPAGPRRGRTICSDSTCERLAAGRGRTDAGAVACGWGGAAAVLGGPSGAYLPARRAIPALPANDSRDSDAAVT